MKDLFSALIDGIQDTEAKSELFAALVNSAWKRAAGPELVNRSAPIGLDADSLVIAVSNLTWKSSLESLAPQLLYKLNRELGSSGSVKRLDFRVDPDSVAGPMGKNQDKADVAIENVAPEIAAAALAIRDETMRKTFTGAAANCLARKAR